MKGFIASFFLAAALSAPALADANPALPGTLNFVEGNAAVGYQALTPKSVGSTTLEAGQTINTKTGKAEVLLTPGVYLRVGDNSSAELVNPSITDTKVALNQGNAIVEVDQLHKQNDLQIVDANSTARLMKTGLYEFDTDPAAVRVFKGQADVEVGNRMIKVKGGHQLALAEPTARKLKEKGFDKKTYESSDLYRWSSLRSQYLAEANVDADQIYYDNGWIGPGWYWDPFFASYTFLPGAGMLYSPFGWGFYSPAFFYSYGYPYYYGGYPYRVYGPTLYSGHVYAPHAWNHPMARGPVVAPRIAAPRMAAPRMAAPVGGGFHTFGGGGFRGGFTGGFHGGGRMGR
ncbi:MAG TPA: hypothetical protein VKW78_19945 [Terriglobales bacterium]|nr:hypothetical protein [Terriglobales bacterium]